MKYLLALSLLALGACSQVNSTPGKLSLVADWASANSTKLNLETMNTSGTFNVYWTYASGGGCASNGTFTTSDPSANEANSGTLTLSGSGYTYFVSGDKSCAQFDGTFTLTKNADQSMKLCDSNSVCTVYQQLLQ